MECKSFCEYLNFLSTKELIDTLWNVNVNSATFAPAPPCELIDTLWNVNFPRLYEQRCVFKN